MRFLALFVVLALCPGCKSDRINLAGLDLTVSPSKLEFPRTVVGYPTVSSIEIRNGGRQTRSIQLQTTSPFALEASSFELPGGSRLSVAVRFDPSSAGAFDRTLKLNADGQTLEVSLAGIAELPLACAERGPCWYSKYQHSSGSCIRINELDASPCNGSASCLLNSQCIGGQCLGTAKDCDDRDACTTDACDANNGCVHFPATARCGASTDPCQIPACDPIKGCTFVNAMDGVACGPADCLTADICLLGVCRRNVEVKEGAACGTPSPCQARGLCANQSCVRPAATTLPPEWTVWATSGRRVLWDSIADRAGNVYWREAEPDNSAGHLVSVTSAGLKRFSVPIPAAEQMALIQNLLILRLGAKLEARSVNDGSLKWSREISLEPGVGSISLRTLARGPPGTLYVGLIRRDQMAIPGLVGSAMLALSLGSGATQWEVRLPLQQIDEQATPVDEEGYLYAGTHGVDGKRRYFGITPQGQIRWGIENPHASPAAVFGGRVYHWDHWLSETSSGAWVNATAPTLAVAGYPRLGLGAVSYVGRTTTRVPDCLDGGSEPTGTAFQLVRVDPATSNVSWTREIAGPTTGGLEITNTILTSRSTVLFSQPEDYCMASKRTVLKEISAQGDLRFTCHLPGAERYLGEGLLNDGRWIVMVRDENGAEGVRGIEMLGFELPVHGWATAWGSPARDNRAR